MVDMVGPRYASGKRMPQNVVEGLKVTGKAGFISKRLWRKFFGSGNFHASRKQIQRLKLKGHLISHPNPIAHGFLVLSDVGKEFYTAYFGDLSSVPPAGQLIHDEFVLWSVLSMWRDSLITQFQLECEFRDGSQDTHDFLSKSLNHKIPDAIFQFRIGNALRKVAFEYERQRKSPERYRDILWLYAGQEDFSLVIFVCETDAILDSIERQLKRIGDQDLLNRVALVRSKEWSKGPLRAPLHVANKVYLLDELCQKFPSESDHICVAANVAACDTW
jgi:hypothetical protein